MNNNPHKHLHNLYLFFGIIVACIVIWQFIAPRVLSISIFAPIHIDPSGINLGTTPVPQGDCPDSNTVARLTHEKYSLTPLSGCGYKFKEGISRTIYCPGQFEAAVETTASGGSSEGNSVIYYCAKGDTRSLTIYGASFWIGEDPCNIAAKHNGPTHVDGKTC